MFRNIEHILKNIFTVSILLLIFISCTEEKNVKYSNNFITDDLHKKFSIEKIPTKVISLAPNLTELLFNIGVGKYIIGNTTYCNYPDSAKKIEHVADLLTVNVEKIMSLQPDIIFITTEGNSKSDYDKLIKLGFNVFVSNPRNYEGIKKTLIDMGKIFDVENKALNIAHDWDIRIEKVKKNHDFIVLKSALFLVSTKPIFSVGKNTFVNEILEFAGLENIVGETKVNYPMYSREDILLKNPDYILLYETNNNDVNTLLDYYPEWNTLSAVINNRVFFINADLYSRPGPRFVDAVEELNELVLSR